MRLTVLIKVVLTKNMQKLVRLRLTYINSQNSIKTQKMTNNESHPAGWTPKNPPAGGARFWNKFGLPAALIDEAYFDQRQSCYSNSSEVALRRCGQLIN